MQKNMFCLVAMYLIQNIDIKLFRWSNHEWSYTKRYILIIGRILDVGIGFDNKVKSIDSHDMHIPIYKI